MPVVLLAGLCLHLDRRALGTLLADLLGLAPSSVRGGLGLLSLLLRLGGGLLLLGFLDGGSSGGVAGLGTLRAALLDHIERGTNDGALVLDGATSSLLGNFL